LATTSFIIFFSYTAVQLTTAHTVRLRGRASLSAGCGYYPGWCCYHPTVSEMS